MADNIRISFVNGQGNSYSLAVVGLEQALATLVNAQVVIGAFGAIRPRGVSNH